MALKRNAMSKVIIKNESDSETYDLDITAAYLDISLILLEANIRREYYDLINNDKLMRILPTEKVHHYNIAKGNQIYFLPNCCSFSTIPEWLTIFLITESQHLGDFSNRFVYKHHNLTHLQAFKNGVPHYGNALQKEMSYGDESKGQKPETSKYVQYWYSKMLSCYGSSPRCVSLQRFCSEFFIFCLDFASTTPRHMFPKDENPLHLVTSGSIDLNLQFSSNLETNLVLYVISHENTLVKVGPTGEIEGGVPSSLQ